VAEVAVRANGTTDQVQAIGRGVRFGNWIAYEPGVLIGLTVLFVAMLAVLPLWRLRNLDLLATLSLVATVPLFQHGYLNTSVVVVAPGLVYLIVRCTWHALGRTRVRSSTVPLFDCMARRWQPTQRVRFLRMVLLTLGLILAMVGIGTPNALDIPYAVMEGATAMLHGLLPYGHMAGDVIHGDTYPILSYALYIPVAWVAPVHSIWDSIYGALLVAVFAAGASAGGLLRGVAGPRPRHARRAAANEARGLRAAIAWLAFPPLMIIVSTGTTDLVLAAMLVFAVLLWRAPAASTAVLALAGWFKLAPFALLPVWLAPLHGAPLRRAIAAALAVSAAALALVIALGGVHGPVAMAHAMAYQFDRGSLQSLWITLGLGGLQPFGQAAALALIVAVAVELRRRPVLSADPGRVAAVSGAILIALQLVANYWSFLYLAWFVPLIGLSLFADSAVLGSAAISSRSPTSGRQIERYPSLETVPDRLP
jgi:hypothetical protein